MKISACVITKNEEKNLPTCLDSVKSIVSEIIVVDTGSTDRTVEIAKSYGAKVFSFKWIDDFAAARNFAIEQATGKWIIFLDADEYFAPDCVKYVPLAIREAEQRKLDMIICLMANVEKETGKIITSNLHIRIFKNHPQIRYVGAIHERIVRLDRPANALDVQKEITIIHTGYSRENVQEREKSKRNLELLYRELEKNPDSFDLHFYIAESLLLEKKFEQALDYALRAQQFRNSKLKGIYEKNYVNIIECMIHLGKPRKEIFRVIAEAIRTYPNYPDFHMYLGDYCKQENRYRDAIQAYQTGLSLMEQSTIAQTATLGTAAKVLDTLGHLYGKVRDWNQCVNYHVQALQIDKFFYTSLYNLMTVLGRFEQPDAVYALFCKMYNIANTKERLFLLRAALDTNQTELARNLLKGLPAEHPSMQEYVALFQFLVKNRREAFARFLSLYEQTKKAEHAYGAIAAAWMEKDQSLAAQLEKAFSHEPELLQLTVNVCGEISPITIEKKKMYEFLIHLSGTLYVTDYHLLADLAQRSNLLYEMGNYLHYRENYADAFQFFNRYLEQAERVTEDLLPDITFKVGDCLMQNGMHEQAWPFLQKAHSLAPDDFRVYEACIENGKLHGKLDDVRRLCATGFEYYPDSAYLQKTLQELGEQEKAKLY